MNQITCLIVNFNCLFHTENLINDLKRQKNVEYELIIVDQNSTEENTGAKLLEWHQEGYTIVLNDHNRPLNHIWNDVIKMSKYEYVAFLNNDIRIPANFLSDTVRIFDDNENISIVVHPTNHPNFTSTVPHVQYIIESERTRQGWDFSFRKSDWIDIPEVLEFYCGDDFIFENVYNRDKKVAFAISSPIIHLLSQTRKSPLNKVIPNRNPVKDVETYKSLGYKHYLNLLDKYSKLEPSFEKIVEYL